MTRALSAGPLLAALLLVGCASDYGPDASCVDGVTAADTGAVAASIETLVRQEVKPGSGMIAVAGTSDEDAIGTQIKADLAQQGYRIATQDEAARHRLGYVITPVGPQVLVRVFLDKFDGAQLYTRDAAGHLEATGPLAVRGAAG